MNTFNVVVDTWNVFGDDTETMLICYAVCHMVGMSSVSLNTCCYPFSSNPFPATTHLMTLSARCHWVEVWLDLLNNTMSN